MHLHIDLTTQRLHLLEEGGVCVKSYAVSTGANGPGELIGSGCTPRGEHRIRAKIGAGMPIGTVFKGRRPTGEIWTPELNAQYPGRDWILTRILWLCGNQPGFNRLGTVDSMRRYIYIHGTPDDQPMGEARSHGCIRMRNEDVREVFDRAPVGALVKISV